MVVTDWLFPIVGALLIATVMLDVFLTVLYARIGTGVLSHHLACWLWRFFRFASRPFARWHLQDLVLSFAGPVMLVSLIGIWFCMLMLGGGLIVQPMLGSAFVATKGPTPHDLVTAMYLAGDYMTTAGASDITPDRTARLLTTFFSLIGISTLTLTLTYILEIYNALQRRNTFALKLHLLAGETADAAELVAGIGPQGEFTAGYTHLAEIGAEMTSFKESHHFYSVLFYFRFKEPYYAVSRMTLVVLDSITLIKSALSDADYAWLKESAAVSQLWRGAMHTLTLLAVSFLPKGIPQDPNPPAPEKLEHWRRRYRAARQRLSEAGIRIFEDEALGFENYVNLRVRWDRYITTFAAHMGHDMRNIDPAGTEPQLSEERQPFETRLRSVG
jgi:hypothetical protein